MNHDSQLEQIIAEFLEAMERGEAPSRSAILAAHPECADGLTEFFGDHDRIAPVAHESPQEFEQVVSLASRPFAAHNGNPADQPTQPAWGKSAADVNSRMEVGDYELIDEIARGGMGVVYRARHLELNRVVALKMIQAGRLAGQTEIDRFLAEAEAVASLSHPGIVPLYEFGQAHGSYYYTMELIEGKNLAEVVAAGPLDPQHAAQIVKLLAEAIAHAHEMGIIHRDLKPSNVLIDAQGRPRITDFGLAKRKADDGELTATGQILGTAAYMPPEQAAAAGKIDERADIYGLGAILYCLCTARPPFEADNHMDLLLRVLQGEPSSPRVLQRNLPRPLEQICMCCLQRLPDDRYTSAASVAEDLGRFLREEPVEAGPPRLWSRIRRWARRHPALATHVGGLTFIELFRQIKLLFPGDNATDDPNYHFLFTAIFVFWIGVSFALQFVMNRTGGGAIARSLWIFADAALATVILILAVGPMGMLVTAYALIIVGSGSFSDLRLVILASALSIVGFIVLVIARTELRYPAHYVLICISLLAVTGIFTGVQTHRLRVLTRHLEPY